MKKFYEKSEIWFAVVWIIIYVVLTGNFRKNFGDDSIYTMLGLLAVSTVLLVFIFKNKLGDKYGFVKVHNSKKYLYFIPIAVLCTLNLWCGAEMNYEPVNQIVAVINMALVGLAEELIFRGLLFKAMEKTNVTSAIIVSAVTFGVGHIVNLFTGQAGLDTILQVLYAIAFGFAFVMMFYRSGSMLPGIAAHALIDITSKFRSADAETPAFNYFCSAFIIVVAGGYAFYLYKCLKSKAEQQ